MNTTKYTGKKITFGKLSDGRYIFIIGDGYPLKPLCIRKMESSDDLEYAVLTHRQYHFEDSSDMQVINFPEKIYKLLIKSLKNEDIIFEHGGIAYVVPNLLSVFRNGNIILQNSIFNTLGVIGDLWVMEMLNSDLTKYNIPVSADLLLYLSTHNYLHTAREILKIIDNCRNIEISDELRLLIEVKDDWF